MRYRDENEVRIVAIQKSEFRMTVSARESDLDDVQSVSLISAHFTGKKSHSKIRSRNNQRFHPFVIFVVLGRLHCILYLNRQTYTCE